MEVRKILLLSAFALSMALLSSTAFATPTLYGPVPAGGNFIGGGVLPFSINVSSPNLNTSSVQLHIKAVHEYLYDNYTMSCLAVNLTDWYCTRTISLAIAGSDTTELYFFGANDTDKSYGSYANETSPLSFVKDIEPPEITFLGPANMSYVNGLETLRLQVVDRSSGVNQSTVEYSFDNSTWLNTTFSVSEFEGEWNTSVYSNNQSVTVFAKAVDLIGNVRFKHSNVTVDNELPKVSLLEPAINTVSGTITFKATANDSYSGVNNGSAKITIGSLTVSLDCVGFKDVVCEKQFNTNQLSDGSYIATVSVFDMTGNTNSTAVNLTISNYRTSIVFTSPLSSYVRGISNITTLLGRETTARLRIGSTWYDMNCSALTCFYTWNTNQAADGAYTLLANVSGVDYLSNTSLALTVDNSKPSLFIESPTQAIVNGTINPAVTITDEIAADQASVMFRVYSSSYDGPYNTTSCTMHLSGKKYYCRGTLNTTYFLDGPYTLEFKGTDMAGNENKTAVGITINKTFSGTNASTTTTQTTASITVQTTTTYGAMNIPVNQTQGWQKVAPFFIIPVAAAAFVVAYLLFKRYKSNPWRVK